MAKVRVYELAKEFGVESKAVMAELEKMGEFVRSASSTIEAPVVRRLKEAFASDSAKPGRQGQRSSDARPAAPAGRRDQAAAGDGQHGDPGAPRVPGGGGAADRVAAAGQVTGEAGAPAAGAPGAAGAPSDVQAGAPGAPDGAPGVKPVPRPVPPRSVPSVPGAAAGGAGAGAAAAGAALAPSVPAPAGAAGRGAAGRGVPPALPGTAWPSGPPCGAGPLAVATWPSAFRA